MGLGTLIPWTEATWNAWKLIPRDACEAYRINSKGVVISCWSRGGIGRLTSDWREKQPYTTQKGHKRIELRTTDGRAIRVMVHVLVLEAFVGPRPVGMEACHCDGNPANNDVVNLRWDSPTANWRDRRKHGRGCEGVKNVHAKLNDDVVREIRGMRANGAKLRELAERFGVSTAKISQISLMKSWRHVDGA
jgi:hypothetical protein